MYNDALFQQMKRNMPSEIPPRMEWHKSHARKNAEAAKRRKIKQFKGSSRVV